MPLKKKKCATSFPTPKALPFPFWVQLSSHNKQQSTHTIHFLFFLSSLLSLLSFKHGGSCCFVVCARRCAGPGAVFVHKTISPAMVRLWKVHGGLSLQPRGEPQMQFGFCSLVEYCFLFSLFQRPCSGTHLHTCTCTCTHTHTHPCCPL